MIIQHTSKPQTSTLGRKFVVVGTEILPETKKYIKSKKSYLHHYLISIKYLDDNTYSKLEINYDDKVLRVVTD